MFWPYPGDPSAFDFSLKSYMVNFLSHSSEMEKFLNYTKFKKKIIIFYTVHLIACYLLQPEARPKR